MARQLILLRLSAPREIISLLSFKRGFMYLRPVKKGLISISFLVLFINTCLQGQLIKIPFLFSHFIEHHEIDNRIGILDFLEMHYWGDDLNDNDDEKDMQLPLKKPVEHASLQVIVPPARPITINRYADPVSFVQPLLRDPFLPNPSLGSLFRPPRA